MVVLSKHKKGKYRDWITEEGLLLIEGWARDGLVDEEIAKNIGIHPSTLYDWKNKFPEISEALKKGKEVVDRLVENALLKRAIGYEYEETKQIVEKDEKGKERKRVEKTTKHMAGDVTAMAIWLNNRVPDKYRRNAGKERLDEKKFEHEKVIDSKKYW